MSEMTYSRAIVMGPDSKRVRAFVDRLKTPTGYRIPDDPTHQVPDYYTTVKCPDDGLLEAPVRTTLSRLRRRRSGGLPPVRLNWSSAKRIAVVTVTHWCEAGACGRCTMRDLRQIATTGAAGLAGQLKWLSRADLSDLHFLCSFLAFESWLVGWHLLKEGRILQGGAWQRPSLKHNRRYISTAQRWTGCIPGGDTLLSDFDFEYEDPAYSSPPDIQPTVDRNNPKRATTRRHP